MVFPDGTGPALLSCMIAGIPFNRVHELEYAPGEIRLNVTMASTLKLFESTNLEGYNEKIESGKVELERLRDLPPEEMVSAKDIKIERDRQLMETQLKEQKEAQFAQQQQDERVREERAAQLEAEKEQRRRREQEQKEARQRQLQEERDEKQRRIEEQQQERARRQQQQKEKLQQVSKGGTQQGQQQNSVQDSQPRSTFWDTVVYSGAGLGAVGAAVLFGGGEQDGDRDTLLSTNTTTTVASTEIALSDAVELGAPAPANEPSVIGQAAATTEEEENEDSDESVVGEPNKTEANAKENDMDNENQEHNVKTMVDEKADKTVDTKDAVKEGEMDEEDIVPQVSVPEPEPVSVVVDDNLDAFWEEQQIQVNGDGAATLQQEVDPKERVRQAMDDYLNQDDGADAWLQSLSDLLLEDDDTTNDITNRDQ